MQIKEKEKKREPTVKAISKKNHGNQVKTIKVAEPLVTYEVCGNNSKSVTKYLEIGFEKKL